jgi:hypothetical protein
MTFPGRHRPETVSGSRSHAVSRSSPHQIGRWIVRREDAGRRDGEAGTLELRPSGLDGEKILTSSNWQRERTREEAGRGNGEAGASEMPVTGLDGKMGGGWWCAPQYNAAASAPPLAAGHPYRPRTTTGLLARGRLLAAAAHNRPSLNRFTW